jgi:hypothetical protein
MLVVVEAGVVQLVVLEELVAAEMGQVIVPALLKMELLILVGAVEELDNLK